VKTAWAGGQEGELPHDMRRVRDSSPLSSTSITAGQTGSPAPSDRLLGSSHRDSFPNVPKAVRILDVRVASPGVSRKGHRGAIDPIRSTPTEHRPGRMPPTTAVLLQGRGEATSRWLASTAYQGLRMPAGLREAALLATLWIGYSATRLMASNDLSNARRSASDLLDLERYLHVDIEAHLNHAAGPVTQLAVPMAFWYATFHYLVTPIVLGFLFFRHRAHYGRARNALAIGSAIGLLVYLLIPMAPPRLMSGDAYLDVLAQTAQYGWWSSHASAPAGLGGVTNELAAMPSLHVGWAVWVAWALWRHVGFLGRSVASIYAIGTAIVVLATGNHWLLDAAAGAAVVALGTALSGRIHTRRAHRSEPTP